MTQLPPKALAMDKKWPSFGYQAPSWINDFIDFSSSKRNNHRRSSSDPIAFVETPFINECGNSIGNESLVPCSNNNGFDRLDDEQLSSMFSDEYTKDISLSILSPCDQSSDNDKSKSTIQKQQTMQLKNEPGKVEDEHEKESVKPHITFSSTVVDPKRVKRILANRQSAQRSRVRKLHYVSDLERSVTTLQTEVSTLSPRVAFLDHQRLILNVDNSSLKQRIAVLAQDKIFKDAHQEALKKEIERLRRVYQEQNMNKTDNTTITTMFTHPTTSPPRPPAPSVNGTDEG